MTGRRLWARHRRDDARRRAETREAAADSGHCRCGLTSADGGQLARAGQWPVPGRAGLLLYPAPPHNNIPCPELRTAVELVCRPALSHWMKTEEEESRLPEVRHHAGAGPTV